MKPESWGQLHFSTRHAGVFNNKKRGLTTQGLGRLIQQDQQDFAGKVDLQRHSDLNGIIIWKSLIYVLSIYFTINKKPLAIE